MRRGLIRWRLRAARAEYRRSLLYRRANPARYRRATSRVERWEQRWIKSFADAGLR